MIIKFNKFKLNEDPDTINYDGYKLQHSDNDAFPFVCNLNGECLVGDNGDSHSFIWKFEIESEFISNYTNDKNDMTVKEIEEKFGVSFNDYYEDLYSEEYYEKVLEYDFIGRFWVKSKIISFWTYPKNRNELKIITEKIKKVTGINMWNNDWKIDIIIIDTNDDLDDLEKDRFNSIYNNVTDEYIDNKQTLIPIKKYNRSINQPKENWIDHIKSPLLKNKNNVPIGIGSKKTSWDSNKNIKLRQKLYQEKFN